MQWVKNRLLSFIGVGLLVFVFSATISSISSPVVLAEDPPAQTQNAEERSCAVEKVGWIVCPIIEHISSLGDYAFSTLSNMFLETEAELVANNSGTFDAWSIARDLANILFAIVFVIIVLSQVTGFGLSNYGIKRMLPRLIVAAIAVNVSYWICQVFVDLSNIGGWVIKDFLSDIASQVSNKSAMAVNIQGTDFQTANGVLGQTTGVLSILAVGVLALGAVLFFLPILGSVALMVFLTCLSIIVILLLRKAIIVMLVVVSPVAFVLYLLPNTERLFNRWLKMFIQLLMVFPVISLLFGGGQLASAIVLAAGSQGDRGVYESGTNKCITLPNSNPSAPVSSQPAIGDCGRNGTPILLGIIAAGIAVAPLIAVWPVLQGALSATGSVGGKITSMASRAGSRGPLASGAKALDKRKNEHFKARWQNYKAGSLEAMGSDGKSSWAQRRVGRLTQKGALRETRLKGAETDLERQRQEYIARVLATPDSTNPDDASKKASRDRDRALDGLSDAGRQRAIQNAQYTIDKVEAEEVQAADATITNLGLSGGELRELATTGSVRNGSIRGESLQKAAIARSISSQDIGTIEEIMKNTSNSGGMVQYLAAQINRSYPSIKQKGAHLVQDNILERINSGNTINEATLNEASNIAMGSMSAELMANQSDTSLNRIITNVRAGTSNTAQAKNTANELLNDRQLANKIGPGAATTINNIVNTGPPITTP